jgi:hypothetical protein
MMFQTEGGIGIFRAYNIGSHKKWNQVVGISFHLAIHV